MKNISLKILIFMCFLVSACSEAGKPCHIAVSQCSNDAWRSKMNAEILRESMFYDGVEMEFRNADDDNERQKEDIEYFMKKGVDLLVVAPNEAEAIAPAIEKVYDSGIPVVVVDRKIYSEKYTAFLGGDNLQIGKDVGTYIANKLGGAGIIVELAGLRGASPAQLRHEGFVSVVDEYPDIKVKTCYTDWTPDRASVIMDSLLASGLRPDMVYAHNDRMAVAASETARARGIDDMLFVGVDALPGEDGGVAKVLNGDIMATFIYPTNGDKVLQTAMSILQGGEYQRETILPSPLVDGTNARIMHLQEEQIAQQDARIEKLNGMIASYLDRYSNQRAVIYSFIFIIILVIAFLVVFIRAYYQGKTLNARLQAQTKELEVQRDRMVLLTKQLEEATGEKIVFFTNVSHDLRTPLTLIADPVKNMLEADDLPQRHRSMLDLVNRNVNILLRLVNQILDFRTYENGKMACALSYVNLQEQIEEWAVNFKSSALKKHINFSCNVTYDGDYGMDLDVEKIERVFFNLISNAFKFTNENGNISINLSHKFDETGKEFVVMAVRDDGRGIPEHNIPHIFERFYKIDVMHSSSGIGLSLTKAFVELHGGTINVSSEPGKGSVFSVELPVTRNLKETNTVSAAVMNPDFFREVDSGEENFHYVNTEGEATVLVIDDSGDVRKYIKSILSEHYTVIEAPDGQMGLQMAMKYVPDAIICDVMMPVMDGLECCRRIKSEMQTSHIPVMMLTACAIEEQRVRGYEYGADSYISKPFSSKLLQVRLKNLMDNYKRLKEFFGDNSALVKESVSDMDKLFVSRFKKILEENIQNSDVTVEELGEHLGLGRVQLYRKVKALTNYSPVELMRIARLKHAASLLASSDMTVSEIAYESGFTSPSYFTKCYKDYYGESPTELLVRIGKKQ